MSENKNVIVFPEEYGRIKLNSLYRQIPLKDTTFRLLRKYFNAFANLYGVITLEKAYEIISSQCPSLVTEKEYESFCRIARHENEGYIILSDADIYTSKDSVPLMKHEIIDIRLIGTDFSSYFETKRSQNGKEYCIPDKKELLKYEDMFYCESNKSTVAFKNFIFGKLGLSTEKAEYVFETAITRTRLIGKGLGDILDFFIKENIKIENQEKLSEFSELYQNFSNGSRMQCNRGYTPTELFDRSKAAGTPQTVSLGPKIKQAIALGMVDPNQILNQILTMDVPSEELRYSMIKELSETVQQVNSERMKAINAKVGRNDPCPCGSGKKFKHCCGKK